MSHEIMGERALFGDLAHEHRDRAADGLIDIDDEHLLVIAEKDRAPAARRQNCPHLHLDDRFVHVQTVRVRTGNTSCAPGRRLCDGLRHACRTKIFTLTGLNVLHPDSRCALRLMRPRATIMKNGWDIESAIATYNVEGWGEGYYTVNSSGNVEARPLKNDGGSIDLLEVINEARARNLSFPLLIRFQDLLRH